MLILKPITLEPWCRILGFKVFPVVAETILAHNLKPQDKVPRGAKSEPAQCLCGLNGVPDKGLKRA
jgi:hypothetical protein